MSVVNAFNKFKKGGEAPSNLRISTFLAITHGLNLDIRYLAADHLALKAVDFISRNQENNIPECPPSCSICGSAERISGNIFNKIQSDFANINYVKRISPSYFDIDLSDGNDILFHLEEDYCHDASSIKSEINNLNSLEKNLISEDKFWNHPNINLSKARWSNFIDFEGPLNVFMNNHTVIISWQNTCTILKKLRHILTHKLDPQCLRTRTLIRSKFAFMDEFGVLRIVWKNGLSSFKPVIIPEKLGPKIANILHRSLGHSSISAAQNHAKRIIYCQGLDKVITNLWGNCPECVYLGRNSPRNIPMKEVPIPKLIGGQLLADEVHRTKNNKTLKFLFVSDCLSRFSQLYYFDANMNTNKFIDMIIHEVLKDFTPNSPPKGGQKIHIRCDKLASHRSAAKSDIFKEHNVELIFHNSTTFSKNSLPELDGRISHISKILNRALNEFESPTHAAIYASKKFNNIISGTGFSPSEIWTGRKMLTNEQVNIDIEALISSIKAARSANRKTHDLKLRNMGNSFAFKPFSEFKDYEHPTVKPLKVGDIFTVIQSFNKNENNPFFIITSTDDFPTGIDWLNETVTSEKLGLKRKSIPYIISFKAIDKLVNGNSAEAQEFLNKTKNLATNLINVHNSPNFFKLIYAQHKSFKSNIYRYQNLCDNFQNEFSCKEFNTFNISLFKTETVNTPTKPRQRASERPINQVVEPVPVFYLTDESDSEIESSNAPKRLLTTKSLHSQSQLKVERNSTFENISVFPKSNESDIKPIKKDEKPNTDCKFNIEDKNNCSVIVKNMPLSSDLGKSEIFSKMESNSTPFRESTPVKSEILQEGQISSVFGNITEVPNTSLEEPVGHDRSLSVLKSSLNLSENSTDFEGDVNISDCSSSEVFHKHSIRHLQFEEDMVETYKCLSEVIEEIKIERDTSHENSCKSDPSNISLDSLDEFRNKDSYEHTPTMLQNKLDSTDSMEIITEVSIEKTEPH